MGRKEMQSLFSLITAAVFFTAAFFTGRQAAVLTGKFRVEREQSRQSRTKYCVVVDAGHGGDDPGKIGTAGTLEKEINLDCEAVGSIVKAGGRCGCNDENGQ